MNNPTPSLDELSIWIEANRDVPPATWEAEIWPEIKLRFIQAFTADGWVRILANDTTDAEFKAHGMINGTAMKIQHGYMTGQEWYDKAKKELENQGGFMAKDDWLDIVLKKAAGIES